jgi:hypothetical protein
MKKTFSYFIVRPIVKKILLFVKLTFSVLLIALLHVSAAVRSQEKLNINVKNVNLEKLFDLLEKKSNYSFLYNNQAIPDKVINAELKELTVPLYKTPVYHTGCYQTSLLLLQNHPIRKMPM